MYSPDICKLLCIFKKSFSVITAKWMISGHQLITINIGLLKFNYWLPVFLLWKFLVITAFIYSSINIFSNGHIIFLLFKDIKLFWHYYLKYYILLHFLSKSFVFKFYNFDMQRSCIFIFYKPIYIYIIPYIIYNYYNSSKNKSLNHILIYIMRHILCLRFLIGI